MFLKNSKNIMHVARKVAETIWKPFSSGCSLMSVIVAGVELPPLLCVCELVLLKRPCIQNQPSSFSLWEKFSPASFQNPITGPQPTGQSWSQVVLCFPSYRVVIGYINVRPRRGRVSYNSEKEKV